jgi:hypothetical protein
MVLALVELKHRFTAFKVRAAQQPRLFKLSEHAVDGGQADVDVFGEGNAVNILGRHVPMLAALKPLQNLQSWQGGFEASRFEVKQGRHGVVFAGGLKKSEALGWVFATMPPS